MESFENAILYRYLVQATNSIRGAIVKDRSINIRCNICGDGKNPNSKRGHLLLGGKPGSGEEYWTFKCFNEGDCSAAGQGNAWSAHRWLKTYFPALASMYEKEIFADRESLKKSASKEVVAKKCVKKKTNDDNLVGFRSIMKGNTSIYTCAREYCQDRKIPKEIWSRFFVCIKGTYKGRMIIPFYDEQKKIYYFQARALDKKQIPKYINWTKGKDEAIYNLHNIDTSKPVCVLEGPIDSMFIDNSIATLGLGITPEMTKKIDSLNSYYIFDNDKAGDDSTKKYLLKGKQVFIWSKFMKEYNLDKSVKDFNDVILTLNKKERFTFDELKKYFSNSKYDLMSI